MTDCPDLFETRTRGGVDDLPRIMRSRAVTLRPGETCSVNGLSQRDLLDMARRLERLERYELVVRQEPVLGPGMLVACALGLTVGFTVDLAGALNTGLSFLGAVLGWGQ